MEGTRAQSSATAQIQKLFRGHLGRRRLSPITNSGSVYTVSAAISKMKATKGLPEGQKFGSKKENFQDYAKLIGHLLEDFRLEENGTSLEKVREYVNLVWTITGQDATLLYFKKYGAAEPADRNTRRLKKAAVEQLLS
eukprot:14118467-Ditylum_brightwellii.AAC.1